MSIQSIASSNFIQLQNMSSLRREAVSPNPPELTQDEASLIENTFKTDTVETYTLKGDKLLHNHQRGVHVDHKA